MLLALKFKLMVMAGIMAAPVVMHSAATAPRADGPEFVTIAPTEFSYRVSGDFSREGRPAEGPRLTARLPRKLAIMKHQITVAEYRRCIEAGACPRINISDAAPDRPMVGVSWHDAA